MGALYATFSSSLPGGSETVEEQIMVGLLHGKQAIVILSEMPV